MNTSRLFLTLALFASIFSVVKLSHSSSKRHKKLFSLLNVVKFQNNPCLTTNTAGDIGTCYTADECTTKNGYAQGNCAAGFGVCCLFRSSVCGSTITENNTYITNPGFPVATRSMEAQMCTFTVTPKSSSICQLRLDFDAFEFAVDNTGACIDSFTVNVGSERSYPTLCGTLMDQHIYLEIGRGTGSQTLTFMTAADIGSTTFNIRVSQIYCFSKEKAPADCFQYFTGPTGRIMSFNFGMERVQLQNLEYTSCIRREFGFCAIQWAPTQGLTLDPFQVAGVVTTSLAGGTIANLQPAFIALPGTMSTLYSGTNLADTMETLNSAQLATGARFLLEFYSRAISQVGATGFDLTYTQQPC